MRISRRRFVSGTRLALAASALPGPSVFAAFANNIPSSGASAGCRPMGLPTADQLPKFRWWWPGGYVNPEQIEKDVEAMADAGFGGFEIADVRDGVQVPMDPKIYGWGSKRWIAGVERALEVAARRGLKADITLGAHWPTGMPGVTPDSPAAAKELVHGLVVLPAGKLFRGPLPEFGRPPSGLHMHAVPPGVTPQIVAVHAYREVGSDGETTTLDPDSRIDLTGTVQNGSIEWRAPQNGRWHLFAFWMRGTAQTQNLFDRVIATSMLSDPVACAVDVYGKAGTQACIDYWEKHLLSRHTRKLLRRIGGNFFEDSLELKAVKHWSADLPEEFRSLRGYEVTDYLPLLAVSADALGELPPRAMEKTPRLYELKGVDADRFDEDFQHTLTEMYALNRVKVLSAWAATLGMGMRAQCSGLAASYCDVPEGDNADNIDSFSAKAAARDIAGHKVLSDEAATFVGGQAHVADWRLLLFMLQRDFAGGVNQVVLHGFSYADAPDAKWPGFSAFGRVIGNDWGPRSPLWRHASDISGYLGRLQHVLQSGRSQADIVVLEPISRGGVAENFNRNGSAFGETLRLSGYTRHHIEPDLLLHPNAVVENGGLTPRGAAYRALVVMPTREMAPETAEKLVSCAEAGLSIVLVGRGPDDVPGLADLAGRKVRLSRAWKQLKQSRNVSVVDSPGAAIKQLVKVGVAPVLGFSTRARILSVVRVHEHWSDFYLLNDSDASISLSLSLRGDGAPAEVDMWTGVERSLPDYLPGAGRISLPLAFKPNQARVLRLHHRASVCAGMAKVQPLKTLQNRVVLAQWRLQVEDWLPGVDATYTRKSIHELKLTQLAAWTDLPGLHDVSGIGRYQARVALPESWTPGEGAILDLGRVGGSFRLRINAELLPPLNQFDSRFDISEWVKPGENTVEVEVATTLNNRLRALGASASMALPVGANPPDARFSEDWLPPPNADPTQLPTGAYLGAPLAGADARMAPGATAPGGARRQQSYGLMGPVSLNFG